MKYIDSIKRLTILSASLLLILVSVGSCASEPQTKKKLPKKFVRGELERISKQVVIGPYPERREMKTLRESGITDIVSFLHPDIPFEKELLDREERNILGTGITLHLLPLKPFVSTQNTKNLDELAQLVKNNPDQNFYLHCFLGKHRVTYGKARVQRMLGRETRAKKQVPLPKRFKMGPVSKMAKGIYFGPTLTNGGSYDLYIARVATIISTLDPDNPKEKMFIKKFNRLAVGFGIDFENITIPQGPEDPEAIAKLAKAVKKAKKIVYISSVYGDQDRVGSVRAAVSKALE